MGLTIVGRGAGTGLSGGAIARAGGIIISFARMNRILEIDLANERAVVQPGVVNIEITQAVEADGYFYAPDPSSQRACTIGGNVSENSGGPHTLAYGVTTNHVLGMEAVLPDGSVIETGGGAGLGDYDLAGYDLAGLLVGSEGTMVLVTKIIVRLMRKPEVVKTILAIYDRAEDAGDTVAEITARAITPVAIEMLDGPLLQDDRRGDACRLSVGCGGSAADRTRRYEGSRRGADRADSRRMRAAARRASFASRRRPRSASCYGRAARTRSARWADSVPHITCRTAWCRARKSRRR